MLAAGDGEEDGNRDGPATALPDGVPASEFTFDGHSDVDDIIVLRFTCLLLEKSCDEEDVW